MSLRLSVATSSSAAAGASSSSHSTYSASPASSHLSESPASLIGSPIESLPLLGSAIGGGNNSDASGSRSVRIDDDGADTDEDDTLTREDDGQEKWKSHGNNRNTPIIHRILSCGRTPTARCTTKRLLPCYHRFIRLTTCCCPLSVQHKCITSPRLSACAYIILLIIAIIAFSLFYHVWDMYSDSGSSCLRTEEQLNTFRYILYCFNLVATKYNIEYWADFGVLLGGSQRGDVLPWDRDIDLSMTNAALMLLRSDGPRSELNEMGIFVCPYRKCLKPMWTRKYFPEVDINLWEIDEVEKKVVFMRTAKEAADPVRQKVFEKYYDFPLSYLYPLRRMAIGSVEMTVPFQYEELLRLRYPHSYGISLPYNPRCWWSALTSSKTPAKTSSSSSSETSSSPPITITIPPEYKEVWGKQKVSDDVIKNPIQYLWNEVDGFTLNPEWVEMKRRKESTTGLGQQQGGDDAALKPVTDTVRLLHNIGGIILANP